MDLKRKNERHQWILQIQNGLATKFKFKQTFLMFGFKFVQKEYFRSKREKVNITVEFYIFELS